MLIYVSELCPCAVFALGRKKPTNNTRIEIVNRSKSLPPQLAVGGLKGVQIS